MANTTTKQAQPVHHGIGSYVAVWIALIVFTIITVVTGRLTENIYLAMGIACTKAALVVFYFMHLKDSGAMNKLVFAVSLLFVATLLLGVLGDILTRPGITLPFGGPAAVAETPASHGGSVTHEKE